MVRAGLRVRSVLVGLLVFPALFAAVTVIVIVLSTGSVELLRHTAPVGSSEPETVSPDTLTVFILPPSAFTVTGPPGLTPTLPEAGVKTNRTAAVLMVWLWMAWLWALSQAEASRPTAPTSANDVRILLCDRKCSCGTLSSHPIGLSCGRRHTMTGAAQLDCSSRPARVA